MVRCFFILVILIIIVIIIYCYIKIKNFKEDPYYYKYSDIRQRLKTGDIIMFGSATFPSYLSELGYLIRTKLFGTEYSHVGIVVRQDENLFMLEIASSWYLAKEYATYFNKHKEGMRLIDLDTVLNIYYDDCQGNMAVRFISKEISNDKLIKVMLKYKDYRFQDPKITFLLAFIDICISHDLAIKVSKHFDEKKTICTEFMYNILRDCDVLKNYPAKLFWPIIIDSNRLNDLAKVTYSKPYKFNLRYELDPNYTNRSQSKT